MSVLTKRERLVVLGTTEGTKEEKQVAIDKLRHFQWSKSDRGNVNAINRLIPGAEKAAKKAAKAGEDFSAVFHGEMKARARAQGLRQ